MRIAIFVALLAASGIASASPPSISVGPLFDYLQPGSSNLLKRIRNTGDVTAYVRVEVTRMHFDADGTVNESPVDTTALVRNADGVQGLIASPSRLIIAANGQQATRLVHRGSRDEEHYYRLRFIPVAPSADEFSLSEEEARAAVELTSSIKVFTGFGTILFVAPDNVRYDTRIEGNRIHNDGNATVVLDNVRQCDRTAPDTCDAGVLVHVRPGRSHVLAEDPARFHRFELMEGGSRRSIDSRR